MKNIYFLAVKLFAGIFLSFLALSITGCEDGITPNIFSPEDDLKLGLQLDRQIRTNTVEYPLLNSSAANLYLQNIVNEIIQTPTIKYRGVFSYKVEIIRNDAVINAFAAPGGYLYVYTGLIKFLDSEAEIAGVLGHEIAHAECRHATERMTKAYGIQLMLDVVLGKNPSQLEEIGANLLTGLALLKNSRDDEYEADEKSFKYLQSTKWYPGALMYFFDKINDNSGSSAIEELLSTHPLPQNRIDAFNKLMSLANLSAPNESNLFAQRYAQYKASLP